MTRAAPRLWSAAVLVAGLLAGAVVVPLAVQGRRADRAEAERSVLAVARSAVAQRAQALGRMVRGPALAFDLSGLPSEEVTGLLRLVYAQGDGVAAVTLLDRAGNPVVLADSRGVRAPLPAVFMARAGALGGVHPVEGLDDLSLFSQHIPLSAAIARGRSLSGPYASVHGVGARLAVAEAVPVEDGTQTWVLAAEVDATGLLDGLAAGGSNELVLVTPEYTVGSLAAPAAARDALTALARRLAHARGGDGPIELAGRDWRAVAQRAPEGLDGVVAIVVRGDDEWARRTRDGALGLGVLVASIVGALAVVLWFALRAPGSEPARSDAYGARAAGDLRVLGAIVKELANPIAAATAAARLVATELQNTAPRGRALDALARSALRLERTFRRVARVARAGEERPRENVDLCALVARAAEALRCELEPSGGGLPPVAIELAIPTQVVSVRGDPEDLALLVEVLLEAARLVAPPRSSVRVSVEPGPALRVEDGGRPHARERRALMELGEAPRTETGAPALGWALAARIAADQRATVEMADLADGRVEVRVVFEPARA